MRTKALLLDKTYNAVLHILVWVLLFILPLFYNMGKWEFLLLASWIPLIYCMVLFYLNYFVLIEKILLKKQMLRYIFYNVLLIFVLVFLLELTKEPFRSQTTKQMILGMKKWIYFRIVVSFVITIVVSLSVRMTQKWLEYEREKANVENQMLKSELTMLRFQIQPHFFFNALNNIYSLIDISADKAKETVHGLGKLMRYLLYETNSDKVSLEKEVVFIRHFIALMKIRLSDNVKIIEQYPDSSEIIGIEIAPLLFITLIENAFKHGVSASHNSEIIINMRIENNLLIFVVQNNNYPKNREDKGGSGVGMENLRSRLQKLYPNNYDLHQQLVNNHFTTSLTLTL